MISTHKHRRPEISVIIPVHNSINNIVETVDCVLAQTYSASEIIVVDCGSVDGSAIRVEKQRGESIRIVHQLEASLAGAINLGASVAKHEVLAFLNVGDQWEPHFLEEISQLHREFSAASCYATAYQMVENENSFIDPKSLISKNVNASMLLTNYFDLCSKGCTPLFLSNFCLRKSAFLALGGVPKNENTGSEQEFLARAALMSTIAYSHSILAFHGVERKDYFNQKVIPFAECAFSRNIYQWANEEGRAAALKESMIDYTASHLFRLIDLNLSLGRINTARNILSDQRCKRRPLRYIWCVVKCWFSKYVMTRPEPSAI